MAPKGKDHNSSGLGRAIINQKAKDTRRAQESGLFMTDVDNSTRLKSITQERDLDEFLNTAQLAGIEFTAERRNVKIVQQSGSQNPFLLEESEQQDTLRRHEENRNRLLVPRRPPWTKSMTLAELDRQERAAFLGWRRGLAQLQDEEKFLLTPFERNLEVWRQLWRVLERSHLVVQIVDARNPLHFRCEDLESYVLEVEGNSEDGVMGKGKRRNLLLLNKADLLTPEQRREWSSYFEQHGIEYAFYSAANAAALQLARQGVESSTVIVSREEDATDYNYAPSDTSSSSRDVGAERSFESQMESNLSNVQVVESPSKAPVDIDDPKVKILTVPELEELFLRKAPDLLEFAQPSGEQPTKLVVGLVGYPNVGKSSTINSLLGEKRVSVSSTPGKTKHFQTIHLSETIVLCDCPGLVFPQFATTKAELVCDGVLPIDQLREHTGPTALVAQRIPKEVLEATYGISLRIKGVEEGGDGKVSAENLLQAYAIARGFMRSSQGNPDEARAARYVLKDYVNGKLLFSHPPPGVSADDFNGPTHILSLKCSMDKKRAPTTRVTKDSDTFVPSEPMFRPFRTVSSPGGFKSSAFDQAFFQEHTLSYRPHMAGFAAHGKMFARLKTLPHQNAVADDGTPLDSQQARLATLMDHVGRGKKCHKKAKREKQRSGRGYDDD